MIDPSSLQIARIEAHAHGWTLHLQDGTSLHLYHPGSGVRPLTVKDIRDNAEYCVRGALFERAHLLRRIAAAQALSAATS